MKFERKKIVLEIITPFFISSGEEYLDIDYVYDENKIKIIDKDRFNKRVFQDKKLYEKLLNIADDTNKLKSFFKNNAKEFLYDVSLSKKVSKLLANNKSINIKKFIRDKYTQTPIIPGSTIKGVIRTSLANYYYHNQFKNKLQNENSESKFLNAIFRNYENDAKRDVLKALYISDLKPIRYETKVIRPFYKINIEDEPNDLDVLEVLVNGKFEGEIVINKVLKNYSSIDLSFNVIEKSLEKFFSKILSYEKNRINNPDYKFPEYKKYLIKVGLHSGAGSKTIEGKRKIKVKLKNEKKPKILDYQLSTWFDENKNALGWAKLEFKD